MQRGNKRTGTKPAFMPRAFRRVLGFGLTALVLTAVGSVLVCQRAWRETQRREAYLPELERLALRDRYDAPLLAVLGARLCEGRQFAAAGQVFERAAGAGDRSLILWRTWAAAEAAAGEP